MGEWYAPKGLKDLNKSGIFSYADEEEAVFEKSVPNRWKQQRDADGSPHTRTPLSALTPPPAGPKLTQRDLNKAVIGDSNPEQEAAEKQRKRDLPDKVVKAYLDVTTELISKGYGDLVLSASQRLPAEE